jgi:hypothetical protein
VVFAELAVAVGMGMWLAGRRRRRWVRWVVVVVGGAMLLPNTALPGWRGRERVPALFAGGDYRSHIAKRSTVLALPFAYQDNATLWQARTAMYFKLSDAYLRFPPASYSNGKDPALDAAVGELLDPAKVDRAHLAHYLRARRIDTIVLDAGRPSGYNVPPAVVLRWWLALRRLGLQPTAAGGVFVYHLPARGRLP